MGASRLCRREGAKLRLSEADWVIELEGWQSYPGKPEYRSTLSAADE
jgi:hypothetical protein